MKQNKLVTALYRACFAHDENAIRKLRKKEFAKIAKHRAEGKPFGVKWAIVQV